MLGDVHPGMPASGSVPMGGYRFTGRVVAGPGAVASSATLRPEPDDLAGNHSHHYN